MGIKKLKLSKDEICEKKLQQLINNVDLYMGSMFNESASNEIKRLYKWVGDMHEYFEASNSQVAPCKAHILMCIWEAIEDYQRAVIEIGEKRRVLVELCKTGKETFFDSHLKEELMVSFEIDDNPGENSEEGATTEQLIVKAILTEEEDVK